MTDSEEEEKVERIRKPRTPAQQEAVKRMLEGRKKWAEEKRKAKEEEKLLKKEAKKKIKEQVSSLDALTKEELAELSQKAIGQKPLKEKIELEIPKDFVKEEIMEEPSTAVHPSPILKPTRAQQRKPRKPKKRVVINNYYEEESESSSEEEVVNNYYSKKKKKKIAKKTARRPTRPPTPIESSSSEEESDIEISGIQPQSYTYQNTPFNPMGDIIFR
jgi:hypothetical protein